MIRNHLLDYASALRHDLADIGGNFTLDERALQSALELKQHICA